MLRQDTIDVVKFQRKPLHETLATLIAHNSCNFHCYEWNRIPNAQLFAVITIFEVPEEFLSSVVQVP